MQKKIKYAVMHEKQPEGNRNRLIPTDFHSPPVCIRMKPPLRPTFTKCFAFYPFSFGVQLVQVIQRVFVSAPIDFVLQLGREFSRESATGAIGKIPLDEDFGAGNSWSVIGRVVGARGPGRRHCRYFLLTMFQCTEPDLVNSRTNFRLFQFHWYRVNCLLVEWFTIKA